MNQQLTRDIAHWLQARYPMVHTEPLDGGIQMNYGVNKWCFIQAITPNNALEQAKAFVDSCGIPVPLGLHEAVSASLQREIDLS